MDEGIAMAWYSRRVKKVDKTWWYVSYSFMADDRLHCQAMVYTITSRTFNLHAIEQDLKKRIPSEGLTILGWNKLTQTEGEKIVAYFRVRAEDLNSKLKE